MDSTLAWLNSLEDSINFTKEEERNNSIPFLDVTVIKNGFDLEFDIYRKPTFTGSNSFHNYSHKMAALHSMAHRMLTLPLSSERYDIERNHIIDIGRVNGSNNSTVDNIIKKHEIKKQRMESSISYLQLQK